MKNQMFEENYEDIHIPEQLSQAVQEGIEKGKKIRRKQFRKRITVTVGSAAAVCSVFFIYCFANPTFASELPLIGRIFAKTEQKSIYPGDYSQRAEILEENTQSSENEQTLNKEEQVPAAEGSQTAESEETQTTEYGDTDQNVTVIPKEVFLDGSSLYIAFQLKTLDEEGFGQEILKTGVEWYNLDYSTIQMDGTWSDGNGEHVFSEVLIGEQTAHDTFEGRLKIAATDISKSVEEIQLHISYLFWENYNKWADQRRQAELWGEENIDRGDCYVIKQGDWNLKIPVKMDASQVKTVTVNETNTQGFGIESITVTPYEIKIVPIIPELNADLLNQVYTGFENLCTEQLGEEGAKTFLVETLFDSQDPIWYGGFAVFNQDGERMEFGSSNDHVEIHEGKMRKMETLYFYLMPDDVTAFKCQDQAIAEKCNIFSFVLEM